MHLEENLDASALVDGELALSKIDPTGATANQGIIWDGNNVVWGNVGTSLPSYFAYNGGSK